MRKETKLQMSLDQREDQCRAVSMLPTADAIAAGIPVVVGEGDVEDEVEAVVRGIVMISPMKVVTKVPQPHTGVVVVAEVADPSGDVATMMAPRAVAPTVNVARLETMEEMKSRTGIRVVDPPAAATTGATTEDREEDSVDVAEAEDVGDLEEVAEATVEAEEEVVAVPGRKRTAETVETPPPAEM